MYEKLYRMLFNAITDALHKMSDGNFPEAAVLLANAQRQAEEMYIDLSGNP